MQAATYLHGPRRGHVLSACIKYLGELASLSLQSLELAVNGGLL